MANVIATPRQPAGGSEPTEPTDVTVLPQGLPTLQLLATAGLLGFGFTGLPLALAGLFKVVPVLLLGLAAPSSRSCGVSARRRCPASAAAR